MKNDKFSSAAFGAALGVLLVAGGLLIGGITGKMLDAVGVVASLNAVFAVFSKLEAVRNK